jgi:hypothetical protein
MHGGSTSQNGRARRPNATWWPLSFNKASSSSKAEASKFTQGRHRDSDARQTSSAITSLLKRSTRSSMWLRLFEVTLTIMVDTPAASS